MEKIRVILADDHDMFRSGIKSLFEEHTDLQVVGQAENGERVIELINNIEADVILMDNHLPLITGIEATKNVLAIQPNLKVIILSAHAELADIKNMMKSGARGYLLKNSSFTELITAIKTVIAGKPYFCKEVSEKLFLSAQLPPEDHQDEIPREIPVSTRELQILRMISNEKTNKEIASDLNISRRTVDTHRRNLLQKLKVKNTAGLVKFYVNWKNKIEATG